MHAVLIFLVVHVVQCTFGNILSRTFNSAIRQTMFEQEIEDKNALHKLDNHIARRLIVMPLTDAFKPHQADLMHGKIQYGDKCSLPSSLGRLIFEKRYEVPWIFEITRVPNIINKRNLQKKRESSVSLSIEEREQNNLVNGSQSTNKQKYLDKAYISPLDFRSPENYIFLPRWLMNDLDLAANDVVDVSLVRIKLASLVVFQPLSLDWDDLMKSGSDPKSLLERELNKYSSLTAGSTIYIEVGGKEYPLRVHATYAEGGVQVRAVRVQDSDVNTDIDRSIVDMLIQKEKERKETDILAS